jgi:hypothetical protein
MASLCSVALKYLQPALVSSTGCHCYLLQKGKVQQQNNNLPIGLVLGYLISVTKLYGITTQQEPCPLISCFGVIGSGLHSTIHEYDSFYNSYLGTRVKKLKVTSNSFRLCIFMERTWQSLIRHVNKMFFKAQEYFADSSLNRITGM